MFVTSDLPQIEDLFKINIVICQLDENVATLIQKSRELYDETMRLNLYQNHLSLITEFEKYCTVYQCSNCDELWYKRNHFLRHCKTCKLITGHTYSGGPLKPKETVFEKLTMVGITVPLKDRVFPYFACFDFECYFDTENLPKNGPQLTFESRHVAFAISSNVPGFQDEVCHVINGDETDLISKMVTCLDEISDKAYTLLKNKFDFVFEAFSTYQNCGGQNLQKEFEQYLHEFQCLDSILQVTICN